MRGAIAVLVLAAGCAVEAAPGAEPTPPPGTLPPSGAPPVRIEAGGVTPRAPAARGTWARFVARPDAVPAIPLVRARVFHGPGGIVGGGVAVFDADGDGWPDIAVTNHGGELIFLRGLGGWRFEEATAAAGLAGITRAVALAIADLEGDGDRDLFVARSEGAVLLANDGAGRFTDVSVEWGVTVTGFVSGGAFGDFDGDGRLDLYVIRYDPWASAAWPAGLPNVLHRNAGGRFVEVARPPGGAGEEAPTLAATWTDADRDGRMDLMVVNDFGPDGRANQLFRNVGPDPADARGWRFEDIAPATGFDVRFFGMGLALGDVDRDLDLDAYVANLGANALLVNDAGQWVDRAEALGVRAGWFADPDPPQDEGPPYTSWLTSTPDLARYAERYTDPQRRAWLLTSWAPVLFDADDDGWLDLFLTNGSLSSVGTFPEGPGQPTMLFVRRGERFVRAPASAFPDVRGASRGGVAADLDRDGDQDLVWLATGLDQDPGLHVAENLGADGHWVDVELVAPGGNRDALGARIVVETADGARWLHEVRTDQGYASAVDPRAHVGLGTNEGPVRIEVTWPDGAVEEWRDVAIDRAHTLRRDAHR